MPDTIDLTSGTEIHRLLYIVEKMLHDHLHLSGESPPGEGPTSDVRGLAAEQKRAGQQRLSQMLDALFPGKAVTVTDAGGKVLAGEKSEAAAKEE